MPNSNAIATEALAGAEERLSILVKCMEARIHSMRGRASRIEAICRILADSLSLDTDNRESLLMASRYHDLGHMATPDAILNKAQALDSVEREIVKRHVGLSCVMLKKFLPHASDVVRIVYCHHERPDGRGLHGLPGDVIPIAASCIALAEAVESMANDRPQRKRLPANQIVAEISRNAGTQFLPRVVEAFLARSEQILAAASASTDQPVTPAPTVVPAPSPQATIATPPDPPAPKQTEPSQLTASRAESARKRLPPALGRDRVFERLSSAILEKMPSPAVARVIAIAANPRAELADLTAIIATDPVLTARVIQVANSAAYLGNRKLLANVKDAVRQIGMEAVRNIAMTLGVFDLVPSLAGPEHGCFDPIRYWQHSLAVARLAERFIATQYPDLAGVAYLAGLCHELDAIMVRVHFRNELADLDHLHQETGQATSDIQRRLLGVDRAELAAFILQRIGLPDTVRSPIQALHAANGMLRDTREPLSTVLWMADLHANGMLLAPDLEAFVAPLSRSQCRAAIGQEHPAAIDRDTFASEIHGITVTLARLSDAEERRLMQPLLPQNDLKVWYARDPSLSTLDPLEALLRRSCRELHVEERLPDAEQLAQGNTMIVASRALTGKLAQDQCAALLGRVPAVTGLWLTAQRDEPLPTSNELRIRVASWPARIESVVTAVNNRPTSE